jgi:hypothetical protein
MSGSLVANPKSGPDYSVIIMYIYFFNFTYPLRCLRVPQVEYHCFKGLNYSTYSVQRNTPRLLVIKFISSNIILCTTITVWHVSPERMHFISQMTSPSRYLLQHLYASARSDTSVHPNIIGTSLRSVIIRHVLETC